MSVLFLPPSAGAASVPDATETVSGKIRIATSAEATTGTDDTTAITPLKLKSVVDAAVVGGVTYQGTFDASSPADLSSASKGDLYIISVAGTYQGQTWAVGDHLLINADMGGTLDPAKIDKVDNTDSVTSVAGRTGAVTLSTADISGLATVASTGAYSDLTGTPTLGTAAAEDVGTSAGNVVQLNGSAQLPAVDGSLLTGITASVAALNDIGDVSAAAPSDTNVIKYNSTSGDWESGAVAYSEVTGTPTLGTAAALDVGTSANNVVQLNGSAQLPAVDGSLLTGITASVAALNDIGDVTITSVQDYAVLKYDSGTSEWIDAPQLNYIFTSTTQSLDLKPGVNRVNMAGSSSITLTLGIPTLVAAQGAVFSVLSTGSATNTLTIGSTSWSFDQNQGGVFQAVGLNAAYMVSTIDYNQLENLPTLGTAAAEDVGTLAGSVVQLDGSARLPAVDGSQLTNLPSAPVTSVAGKTGAVTLVAGDISGLATVATTGAYSDLTGTPTLATVATTGAYSDLTGTPTLGTAAAEDVGTLAGNVVQLDGSARLPAVDGSQLTNLPSAPVTSVAGKTGAVTLVAGDISGLATVATTGAYSDLTGTPTLATVATTGAYSDLTGTPTLGTASAEDVGTSAGNVVQLDGSARLPAVDGSQLTNLPTGGSVPAVNSQAPSANYTITSSTGIEEVWLFTPTTAITVQIPSAFTAGSGYRYQIKNLSSHAITVTSLGGSIDGAPNFSLSLQYSSITLTTDGTNWFII